MAENGVNTNDKVVSDAPAIQMVDNNEKLSYNSDAFTTLSDYVVEPGMRFISEAMEVNQVGCVHRDTMITPTGVATSTTFIPNVRIVPKHDNEGAEIGHMYLHKDHRIPTDPINHRPR
tara:strand:+ start:63 stop:416 length:354 start_codon:yes stop_codon:yes gene_type:complete